MSSALLQRGGVVAGIVVEAGGGGEGELIGRDEVLEADLGGIHFQFGGEDIDHALDAVGGFGAARAAIGVGRNAVGEDADDLRLDVAEVVEARHHEHAERGDGGREQLVVSAEILNDFELQAEDGAVAFGGDFVVIDVAAAVDGGQEVFAAGFDPFDGLADLHGDEGHERFFGIDVELAAEAAADFGRDEAEAVFFEAQHARRGWCGRGAESGWRCRW